MPSEYRSNQFLCDCILVKAINLSLYIAEVEKPGDKAEGEKAVGEAPQDKADPPAK